MLGKLANVNESAKGVYMPFNRVGRTVLFSPSDKHID